MKRFFLLLLIPITLSATAQTITTIHHPSKMNQVTVQEAGYGSLTPTLYYSLLHPQYSKNALVNNKSIYRIGSMKAASSQVKYAENLDSALIKRAAIEASNIADRESDIAWEVEGSSIEKKLANFKCNIDRLSQVDGGGAQKRYWETEYNVLRSGISIIRDASLPNAKKKREYRKIQEDIDTANEQLLHILRKLSSSHETSRLLTATYRRPESTAKVVREAMTRWKTVSADVSKSSSK